MALLGLFKDSEPLTTEAVNMDRVWKTSKFAGYGSNFGLLLSSCGSNRCVELLDGCGMVNQVQIQNILLFIFSSIAYIHSAGQSACP